MGDFDEELGRWMAALREAKHMSQEALAIQLSTEQPTISKIERGQRRVTVEELLRWADVLGVSFEEVAAALRDLNTTFISRGSIWSDAKNGDVG